MIKSRRYFISYRAVTRMVKKHLFFNLNPCKFEFFIMQIINKVQSHENISDVELFKFALTIKENSDTEYDIAAIMSLLSYETQTDYYEVAENETN